MSDDDQVGSYLLALVAKAKGVPVYSLATMSKLRAAPKDLPTSFDESDREDDPGQDLQYSEEKEGEEVRKPKPL